MNTLNYSVTEKIITSLSKDVALQGVLGLESSISLLSCHFVVTFEEEVSSFDEMAIVKLEVSQNFIEIISEKFSCLWFLMQDVSVQQKPEGN